MLSLIRTGNGTEEKTCANYPYLLYVVYCCMVFVYVSIKKVSDIIMIMVMGVFYFKKIYKFQTVLGGLDRNGPAEVAAVMRNR